MMYSESLIEEVRSRNDIVDIISGYVKLKKQGSNHFGICPFHNEKSPSFCVNSARQMFYCFGCGAGGNVFTFIQKYDNCSFPEALKVLADRVNIELPQQEMSAAAKKEQSIKAQILEINKLAAKYYYAILRSEQGALGMKYLEGRALSSDTMQQFGLGYASQGARLHAYLKSKGYSDELLREAGLFNIDERRGMNDKFWNRVIFPIMDINNKVIGFGGRVMGDGKPKYLNSPDTKVFDKSRNLYGLNRAKNNKTGSIIVCEGYMDVISMHQAGFTQAVASLGTAFTAGHAILLKRFTKQVLLIYDSDDAGVRAALRAIPILRSSGISSRVVNLSPYKDPDEFIKAQGADEFQRRLDEAENSFFFELRMEERNYNMSDPDGRTSFLENAASRIAAMDNDVERANYINAVAAKYMIKPEILEKSVAKKAASLEGINVRVAPRSGLSSAKREREDGNAIAQKLLLTWLVDEPSIFRQVSGYVSADDFDEGMLRTVATALYEQLSENRINPAAIVSMFEDEEDHRQVASIFNTKLSEMEVKSEREKAITELVVRIRTRAIENGQVRPVDGEMEASNQPVDPIAEAIEKRKKIEELKKIHISL